ncbi:MAG: methyltransferase [Dehalococcoidia bacterium]
MTQLATTPGLALLQMINGYQVSQAIAAAAALRLADFVTHAPATAADVAARAGTSPRPTYRLLRALASVGIFDESQDQRFTANDLSQLLRSDTPGSLQGWAAFIGTALHREMWGDLAHSVETGQDAARHLHGASIWDLRAGRPEDNAIFNRAMASLSGPVIPAVLEAYDFNRFDHIVDVGGGNGTLLAGILGANAHPRGTVFDLLHVVSAAEQVLTGAGVRDRCEAVPGSFFEDPVPAGADAYILKNVIHDCSDDDSLTILRNIRGVMRRDGRVLVIERLVSAPGGNPIGTFSDLNMLVATGGQERTTEEWRELLASAGLSLVSVTATSASAFIIEAEAV